MKCAIVATGDELITGAVVDENSAWISDRLRALGAKTVLHLGVGDELPEILDALRLAGQRAEQVIVTGGLGPTEDDLNREAAGRLAGVKLVIAEPTLHRLEDIFRMIGREMTANNRKQAELPEGAILIPNPVGTAPGFELTAGPATYYFLPGVPRECRLMMEDTVLPRIEKAAGGKTVFRQGLFRTFGMTESMLSQKLCEMPLPAGVRLGYRAIFPEIQLKLYAEAGSEAAAQKALATAAAGVRARVGEVIYSEDGRSLEEVVLDLFRERKLTLAVAESCTGGLVAKRLTDVPGSSDVFDRGYVTYSNRAKTEMLGVPAELLEKHGAVSAEAARAMAKGAREKSGADLALAITGIAGPSGGTADKPVGTVHLALADREGLWDNRFLFRRAERSFTRELTAQAGLEIIRRRILGLKDYYREGTPRE